MKKFGPMYGTAFCAKGIAYPIVGLPGGGYGVMIAGPIWTGGPIAAHPTCAALMAAGAKLAGKAGIYACFTIPRAAAAYGS